MESENPDFQFFLKTNLDRYKGEYLAISGGQVVAHGDNASEVMKEALRKCPDKTPTLAKLPKDEILILGFRILKELGVGS